MAGRTPWATFGLLVANFVAAFFTLNNPEVMIRWGFIPAPLADQSIVERFLTAFTSLFVHVDPVHLLANTLLLAAAGPQVERAAGALRFVTVYFVCGFAGVLCHSVATRAIAGPVTGEPLVGASASLAGLIGYAWLRFGRAKVPLAPRVYVPLTAVVLAWVVLQAAGAFWDLGMPGGHVGYFAHLGGLVAGFLLAWIWGAGREAAGEAEERALVDAATQGAAARAGAAHRGLEGKPGRPELLKEAFLGADAMGDAAAAEAALNGLFDADPAYDSCFAIEELARRRLLSAKPAAIRVRLAVELSPVSPQAAETLLQSVLEDAPGPETPNALVALIQLFGGAATARVYAQKLEADYSLSPQAEAARERWPGLFRASG
jgi:membrane associated rhomboid family serine protease